MSALQSLTNHFLIAMPSLADPHFTHTVTYVCEHDDEGAMGIVINRPTDISLGEVFSHMAIDIDPSVDATVAVFAGGPIQSERGFILHPVGGQWESSLPISPQVAITTSKDILEALAAGNGPERFLLALGYAGWGPGQLEQEMVENSWLSVPANTEILFGLPPERRWEAAAALIGVDLNLLSSEAGHA